MERIQFGFMNTHGARFFQDSDCLKDYVSFIEIQIHDKLKSNTNLLNLYNVSPNFAGYVTIHGEGETDGKKKILFCSDDGEKRRSYVREMIDLYSSVQVHLNPHKVMRLVVHPDTLSRNNARGQQIEYLVESLDDLTESFRWSRNLYRTQRRRPSRQSSTG